MGIQPGDRNGTAASSRAVDPLVAKFGQLHVLDDVIRLRAADHLQCPLLAYPKSEDDPASYCYYTGRQLDAMIDQAASALINDGFQPQLRKNSRTVALLTLSDLRMVITFFALSRLGYTVMMLSPRLSGEACVSLLEKVSCDVIMYGQTRNIRMKIGEILQRIPVSCHPIAKLFKRNMKPSVAPILRKSRNGAYRKNETALILHSSGSTGNPKPMFLTHKALMTHPLRGPGLTSFNPLPWYHLHGLSTALQAMWMRKTAYLWNAALPLTASSVLTALEEARPPDGGSCAVHASALSDTSSRNPYSEEITEAGLVADSITRPAGDSCWNYLKFFDNLLPTIWMKPIGQSLYECVYLAGHPALTTSNAQEPPGSFHSKDVFMPHPTMPNRWKYVSRLDDRITLMNGEKVLPLSIEGHIKQDPLVHEAVVVGLGRAAPGLLIFRPPDADTEELSEDEYLRAVWPTIEEANSEAEGFSQISRDLVAILPYDSSFPRTDKGSMIRAQVYSRYAENIDELYASAETSGGHVRLDLEGTMSLLMRLCREDLNVPIATTSTDFFSAGVDSLKAMHLRRLILQTFGLENGAFSQNAVYETGSIARLADYICASQSGSGTLEAEDDISLMKSLIQKYSSFEQHTPQASASNSKTVLLTGATGSIGAHTLYELLRDDTVSAVYCLTRRSSPLEGVHRSLADRNLKLTSNQASRIIALNSSLDQPHLGIDERTIHDMRNTVTHIIHAAWPVNFNMPLAHFEPHIHGLQNLLQFSMSVRRPEPATLMFCSSISTALHSPLTEIPESPMDLQNAYMGYGQSKLVGEHIVNIARQTGAQAYSLRIGQVSGHSKQGLWNDTEALPLMIRSALTLRALPELRDTCSWLPVDSLAATIVELTDTCSANCREGVNGSGSSDPEAPNIDESIYNVCNSRQFSWSELLASLKRNGFQFETIPFDKWLELLRESEARGEELINPAVKLIEHYECMHGTTSEQRRSKSKDFITDKAERDSITLRNGRLRIIEDGILNCYIRDWLTRWRTPN
ncbi:AMP-dependent synthetase/ligase [Penicillium chermesinum]|uniref:AMP-dependent synthetase/ligase n=1 Tax=Penicillium chermesinum TaxID=63820 RepID=A0A9W9NPW3_9EURO|nr:AMP-dependent synthetase/ligase [Penicillium chermesinum]KAJ5223977.1 AMP-dependent synthetase/ligase [Penicillium chermesinum]